MLIDTRASRTPRLIVVIGDISRHRKYSAAFITFPAAAAAMRVCEGVRRVLSRITLRDELRQTLESYIYLLL